MPLSAIDAISPAFEVTRRVLFQPFRLDFWARMAIVGLVTGEFASGGWGGASGNYRPSGGGGRDSFLFAFGLGRQELMQFLPWILAAAAALVAFGLLWVYVVSVYRFILLDSVLTGRCELRAGWRRRESLGGSFFLWLVGFSLVALAALALFVGGPVFLAWKAGLFRDPARHVALLVTGGIGLFFVAAGLVLLSVLVVLLAKDFVVPLMATENLGVLEAWRRLMPMIQAEKSAYAVYVLMKLVLTVGSAVLFGIIHLMVILASLIPLGMVSLALIFLGKTMGLHWNRYTVSAVAVMGLAALTALLFVIAFVSAPALVFFQSYTLQFFGARYPALGALMGRTPPGPPAAATP